MSFSRLSANECILKIITVSLNDEARLKKTINSLTQYYQDARFAHVLFDGLSTDNTLEVVAKLKTASNFHFFSGQDSGIYDAMNQALGSINSRYVLFLNCGDCMLASPDELANLLNCEAYSEKNVDIICLPFTQVNNAGAVKRVNPKVATLHKLPCSHQSMLFSNSFLSRHRFNTKYKIAGDYDLYLRANQSKVYIEENQFTLCSTELEGVASQNPIKAYKEYLASVNANLNGFKRWDTLLKIVFRAFVVITIKKTLPKRIWMRLR